MNEQISNSVVIGPSSFAEIDHTPIESLNSAGLKIIDNPYKRKLTKDELTNLLAPNVIGLIAGLETIDSEVLSKSNLKVISRVGSGISNIDLHAAKELGIEVFSTPDGPTTSVAELTVGTLISLMRYVTQMNQSLHVGIWKKKIGIQLEGKLVLIIGFGRIGRRVAHLLSSFNVKILIVDPNIEKNDDYTFVSLEDGLRQADIITIHSSGQECLLGEPEFINIKKGAYLLNAARGETISEAALISALNNGTIAGAWLDCFEKEPYSGKLQDHPNVLLTPHIGSYTEECRKKMESDAVDNLLRGLMIYKEKNYEEI